MRLEGKLIRLRAVEPDDVEPMYRWENDPSVWHVSGTLAPFSRHQLQRFVDEQQFDIYQTRQMRLIIEALETGRPVGALDLFEFEPQHRRAGVGILVHNPELRGLGYATEALELLTEYAREVLGLHQLWSSVAAGNRASLALFRRAGFIETGTRRDWLWSPEGFCDEVMLQRML